MRLSVLLFAAACTQPAYRSPTGGDPDAGRAMIDRAGCAACHEIPGVRSPGGRVGPSLHGLARRAFLGGELPNTATNLVRWIRDPQAIEPGVAMPTLGLTEKEARDVAAYLYAQD